MKSLRTPYAIALAATLMLGLSACADAVGNNTAKTTVYFETGKHNLSAKAQNSLDNLVSSVNNQDVVATSVTGFADRRGGEKQNHALSERRAKAVAHYLEGKGFSAIKTGVVAGVGKTQATEECAGEKGKQASECLSPDRKVEVVVDTKPRMIDSGSNRAVNHSNLQDRHSWRLNQ